MRSFGHAGCCLQQIPRKDALRCRGRACTSPRTTSSPHVLIAGSRSRRPIARNAHVMAHVIATVCARSEIGQRTAFRALTTYAPYPKTYSRTSAVSQRRSFRWSLIFTTYGSTCAMARGLGVNSHTLIDNWGCTTLLHPTPPSMPSRQAIEARRNPTLFEGGGLRGRWHLLFLLFFSPSAIPTSMNSASQPYPFGGGGASGALASPLHLFLVSSSSLSLLLLLSSSSVHIPC